MPSEPFLHEREDFKALIETVADSEKINDPALVEKDYWIMHTVFGLKQLGLTFELKGGTSLSKGFGIIQRKTSTCASNLSMVYKLIRIRITRSLSTSNQDDSSSTRCATKSRFPESPLSRGTRHTTMQL